MIVKRFTGAVQMSDVDDGTGDMVLLRSLGYHVDTVARIAEKGFRTDLSSYPPLTRFIVRFDRVAQAGIMHDKAYKDRFGDSSMTRRYADQMWREIAVSGITHANKTQAWISWLGLRLGGWVTWNWYRNKDGRKYY